MKKSYKKIRKYHTATNTDSVVNELAFGYNVSSPLVHSLQSLLGLNSKPTDFDLINITRKGISKSKLLEISKILGINQEKLCSLLHINPRTLQRIQSNEYLDVFTSELAIEMAKVVEEGMSFFKNHEDFQEWLNSDLPSLNFQKPIDFLDTSFGCNLIISSIHNMRQGVYA
ncbi:MAG: antitoxin Xre-like helix-turn-helix domain-containing protein [Bacteroidia bacterium]